LSAWREKKLRGLILTGPGAFGNAATRIDTYGVSTGADAYGGHPDIDALFREPAVERDRTMREALLHQLQRLMQQRLMHDPIAEPAALHGVGPRVEEPGVGLIPLFAYFGPYEEMRLKGP
jgi:peptide/nickel transport system substrate-binding protein